MKKEVKEMGRLINVLSSAIGIERDGTSTTVRATCWDVLLKIAKLKKKNEIFVAELKGLMEFTKSETVKYNKMLLGNKKQNEQN